MHAGDTIPASKSENVSETISEIFSLLSLKRRRNLPWS